MTARRIEKEGQADDPLWRRYEWSVAQLLSGIDPTSEVAHNRLVTGRYSLTPRQVDVWVTGRVAGHEIKLAVECKRRGRPVTVELIDQFIGKLLDVGADKGVMYAYSGFTSNAVTRAANSRNPSVLVIAVQTPEVVQRLHAAPGYPADLLAQEMAPHWIEELDTENLVRWLATGEWSKYWS